MKDKLSYVSNNLKAYRVKMGYTQEKMAEILGITRTTYCDYEVNPSKLNVEKLNNIAQILNCELSSFFVKPNVTESNNFEEKEE